MSALPDERHEVAADPAAHDQQTDQSGLAEVTNLYAIPHPASDLDPDTSDEGRFAGWLRAGREVWTPPAFWTEDTPSPASEVNRARFGTHLQTTGPLRRAAIVYSVATQILTIRDKAKVWVRAHPARVAVVVLLVGLLLATPARPVVAWILFGLPHLAFEALTD